MKATAAKSHIASRQISLPNSLSVKRIQIIGVNPPRNRADIQIIDLAKPRWEAGNQL